MSRPHFYTVEDAEDGILRANHFGECDECHVGDVMLYSLAEDIPGDWESCLPCARVLSEPVGGQLAIPPGGTFRL